MTTTLRWTSADLETLPENGKRYEIIDGELHVSKQPHWYHQRICFRIGMALESWSIRTSEGQVNLAPGVIFADDEDVAPDVVWISRTRLSASLSPDGKLHAAPELVVEVLSPGSLNERRDREAKLKLYSRRGVQEYWIVDWRARQVEVYRREQQALRLVATLYEADTLQTPLLPDFALSIAALFEDIPRDV
ncbi:MAG TPA: Uma2 family endonuclease [Blastocatellia bacterium]|nr:Uma2 family endonuclease [Blastocatellia bacterium]